MGGKLLVSLDFELFWGMLDVCPLDAYRENVLGGRQAIPHLLDLCRDAYTILAGPSCPLCPDLLKMGIDRIAGLVITDVAGMKNKIIREIPGPPYPMGKPFLLTRERL